MSVLDQPAPAKLMIIDDDEEDVYAVRRAFAKVEQPVEIQHLSDGAMAVDHLLDVKDVTKLPDLVLLDINMPRVNGFETLEALRSSDITSHLPVIMFSTSDSKPEVRRAYSSGANAHLVKPNSMSALKSLMQAISDFWLKSAELPNRE